MRAVDGGPFPCGIQSERAREKDRAGGEKRDREIDSAHARKMLFRIKVLTVENDALFQPYFYKVAYDLMSGYG